MTAWTNEAKERARAQGRYLVKVTVQGRHVDGSRIEVAGDCSVEVGRNVIALVARIVGLGDDAETSVDIETLRDLVSLVVRASELPTLAAMEGWTAGDREEVERWAALEHLDASDNDVERVPMPDVMKRTAADWRACEGHGSKFTDDGRCVGCGLEML